MADTSPQPNVTAHGRAFIYPPKFWMLVIATGTCAGLAGGLLMRLLRVVEHLSYRYGSGEFLEAVMQAPPTRRVAMLLCAGIIAGVAAYLLPRMLGIEPVGLTKAIWFRSGRLPFLPTIFEALVSIVIVGMGVSLGREGALKDAGGAIASKLSDWFRVPPDQRRLLVACAAGAGMAAAYNIPLGGAMFAVEILLGTLSVSIVLPALATSLIATAVSWLFLPNQPSYAVPAYTLQRSDILWAVLAAPLFALASALWVRAIGWAERKKPKGWLKVAAPILVFTLIGMTAKWFPDLLGNGKGLVQRAYTDQLGFKLLAPLLVLRFVATGACLATGAPGGVFTPTMTYGALLGGMLGRAWALVIPGTDVGVFAVIGSAAVLAVTTQGPISSIVMVMELTHHVDALMVPLLIATVGASIAAQWFEPRSVYSAPINVGAGLVALPAHDLLHDNSANYILVSSAAAYATVIEHMLNSEAHCFVVNDKRELVGEISRTHIKLHCPLTPLDGTTAADIAQYVQPLQSSATRAEKQSRLSAAYGFPLPVIDASTGRFVGAIQRHSMSDG